MKKLTKKCLKVVAVAGVALGLAGVVKGIYDLGQISEYEPASLERVYEIESRLGKSFSDLKLEELDIISSTSFYDEVRNLKKEREVITSNPDFEELRSNYQDSRSSVSQYAYGSLVLFGISAFSLVGLYSNRKKKPIGTRVA